MTPTEKLIAEARELDRKATPGPWEMDHDGEIRSGYRLVAGCNPIIRNGELWSDGIRYPNPANSDFVARSRTLLPALCDALEKETAQNKYWVRVFEELSEKYREKCDALEQAQATLEQTWEWDMYKAAQKEIERLREAHKKEVVVTGEYAQRAIDLEAETARLREQLTEVTAQRDAAVEDLMRLANGYKDWRGLRKETDNANG